MPALTLLLLPVLGSALWYGLRQRNGGARDVIRLTGHADGTWDWECADGHTDAGRVAVSSVCTPLFAVLHLRGATRRRPNVVLLPDSLGADAFRLLRARLRLTHVSTEEKRSKRLL